jgi:iron complex transport system substrate-binding protein
MGRRNENAKPLPVEAGVVVFSHPAFRYHTGGTSMKKVRSWLLPALVASLAIIAIACGDDDEAGNGAATDSPAATTPADVDFEPFECEADYPGTEPDASAFPLEETDDSGGTVSFESPPDAIVSLSAAHVEVLYAIGAGDQLIAGDLFSDCPTAATELEQLDSFTPSIEAITALEPDLVVLGFSDPDLQAALSGVDITSMLLEPPADIDGVLQDMELLGRVTGHAEEAASYTDGMEARIDEIVAELPEEDAPPKVFHEVDNLLYTAGPGSFVADLYELLKAENIAEATGQPFPQMTQEAIIEAAPDVIILADEEAGESAETVSARPGWDAIPAVQEQRIYAVDPDIVSRPGPRVVEALETLSGLLYEE